LACGEFLVLIYCGCCGCWSLLTCDVCVANGRGELMRLCMCRFETRREEEREDTVLGFWHLLLHGVGSVVNTRGTLHSILRDSRGAWEACMCRSICHIGRGQSAESCHQESRRLVASRLLSYEEGREDTPIGQPVSFHINMNVTRDQQRCPFGRRQTCHITCTASRTTRPSLPIMIS
jgi:hypothetical protein